MVTRVTTDGKGAMKRGDALAGAAVVAQNGVWRVWVEHATTCERIFESDAEKSYQQECSITNDENLSAVDEQVNIWRSEIAQLEANILELTAKNKKPKNQKQTTEISKIEENKEYVLVINEVLYHTIDTNEDLVYSEDIYKVSTRKLDKWIIENSFAYSYVEHIIQACLDNKTDITGSKKYRFSDCPDWYAALEPDADCTDEEKHLTHSSWIS